MSRLAGKNWSGGKNSVEGRRKAEKKDRNDVDMSEEGDFDKTFEDFLDLSSRIQKDTRRLSRRIEEVVSASPVLRPARLNGSEGCREAEKGDARRSAGTKRKAAEEQFNPKASKMTSTDEKLDMILRKVDALTDDFSGQMNTMKQNQVSLSIRQDEMQQEVADKMSEMQENQACQREENNRRFEHLERLVTGKDGTCLLYTSPSPRDKRQSRMPSSA